MKILIYGFGRMGITHFSILNALNSNLEFTIIEPNKLLLKILSSNINANFFHNDSMLDKSFDITLITTPPSIHLNLLNRCIERGDKKIFIEKPFGGHNNILNNIAQKGSHIFIGYVLRFNPCIQWIKANIDIENIDEIKGQYLSNTIQNKPKGWRNGSYSGVLNEMGSHVLDLIQYITCATEINVLKSTKKSVVSDVDDIVEADLITDNNIKVSLYLNWVKKEIRKPVFGLEIKMKDGSNIFVDQQQINIYSSTGDRVKNINVTNLTPSIPFYLRGVDFTNQMMSLLGECSEMSNYNEALNVNKIMKKIINYENNFRR